MFVEAVSGRPVDFRARDVVLAGYTGRDQSAVRRHIDELAAHGVPFPARTPAYYRVTPDRVVTADRIAVLGGETSGEGEFVMMEVGGVLFIGVGSDHTDRALEREDVARSKQACPKVVASQIWRYPDVQEHWDHIVLRSFVGEERADRPYQEGPVSALLDPQDIMRRVSERLGSGTDGALVFSGTLPLLSQLEHAPRFRVELIDDDHGLRLETSYAVDAVDFLD
jgi:hypothetical protein